jgi:hypothetical protein
MAQLGQTAAAMASRRGAGVNAEVGAGAVFFQGQLPLEGVEEGLDPLADPADGAVAWGLIAAVGADEAQPETSSDLLLELTPGEALVAAGFR